FFLFYLLSLFVLFVFIFFLSFFFFFNDTATTEIYTLSLHDALPISATMARVGSVTQAQNCEGDRTPAQLSNSIDRKSTRLNSSHANISYAVFCLKKKKGTRSDPTSPIRRCRNSTTRPS